MKNVVARGTLYLMFAQFMVMFLGYVLQVWLGRTLGPSIYGSLGVVLSLIMVTKTFFLTGIAKAMSKFVAEEKEKVGSILRAGLYLQLGSIALCLFLYYFLSAFLANVFHDPGLVGVIRFSSLTVLFVGLSTVYSEGYLNGLRMFKQQAYVELIHSFMRVVLAFVLVYAGFQLYGAVAGYVIAPIFALFFGWKWSIIEKGNTFEWKKLFWFALPITLYYAFILFIMELGLYTVKAYFLDGVYAGYYTAASTLAKINFSLFSVLPLTILPSISSALSQKNIILVQKYISLSLRYALLLLIPFSFLLSLYAQPIILLFYSSSYLEAVSPLQILTFAYMFFTLFFLFTSVISITHRPVVSVYFAAGGLVMGVVLSYIFIVLYGFVGVAFASLVTSFIGFIATSFFLYTQLNMSFPFVSFFKMVFSGLIVYILGLFLPVKGYYFIFFGGLLLLFYYLLLYLTKEITVDDIGYVKSVLFKK